MPNAVYPVSTRLIGKSTVRGSGGSQSNLV